jgi:hypothetical protein
MRNINISKEACDARINYRETAKWCFEAISKGFKEFSEAQELHDLAIQTLMDLDLWDVGFAMREDALKDDLRQALRAAKWL